MTGKDRKEKRKALVEVLNEARKMELQAIVQYMNHHYGLEDMDYGELAGNIKLIAIFQIPSSRFYGFSDMYKIKLRSSGYRLVYEVNDSDVTVIKQL